MASQPAAASPLVTSCHCGRVTLELPHAPAEINECRCTVCYKYGALWSYYPRNTVLVKVGGVDIRHTETKEAASSPSANSGLAPYLRVVDGDGDIGFYRCEHCGCMTHWRGTIEHTLGDSFKMGVNTRMLPEKDIEGAKREVSYC